MSNPFARGLSGPFWTKTVFYFYSRDKDGVRRPTTDHFDYFEKWWSRIAVLHAIDPSFSQHFALS